MPFSPCLDHCLQVIMVVNQLHSLFHHHHITRVTNVNLLVFVSKEMIGNIIHGYI